MTWGWSLADPLEDLGLLGLHDRVADKWMKVAKVGLEGADTDEAVAALAPVLGVDEARVLTGLSRFSLLALTCGARAARDQTLGDLRES